MNHYGGPPVPVPPPPYQYTAAVIGQQHVPIENVPPVRVQVALEYLRYATVKGMKRLAVNDIAFHELDGMDLKRSEANAQASAANLINDYFQGKLEMDEKEQWAQRMTEAQVNPDGDSRIAGPGQVFHCMICDQYNSGRASPGCRLCLGSGAVIVYPARKE